MEQVAQALPERLKERIRQANRTIRNTTTFKRILEYIERNGLDISEETAANHYFQLLKTVEADEACSKCNRREDCPLDPPGLGAYVRTSGGLIEVKQYVCDKEIQHHKQQEIARILTSSRMPELLREKTFENFKVTPGTKEAFERARKFCEKGGKGILFAGPCGVGKSHLAAAIMNVEAAKGREFAFCTTPELLDDIKRTYNSREENSDLMELVKDIDLLFLDDLGAEKSTEWVAERFFVIINARLTRKKSTIITTNYIKPSDLIDKIEGGITGQRIVSRIREMCDWVVMEGKDWRLKP